MKKTKFVIAATIFLTISLSVIQVVVSNMFSTSGVSLEKLQNEIKLYEKENLILSEKYLSTVSFVNISSEASKLGFKDTKNSIYFSNSYPLAKKP